MQGDPEALVRLTMRSLDAGHWRVACRRFLMLRASSDRIPVELQETCEALLHRCSKRERLSMSRAAERWAQLLVASPSDALPSATAVESQQAPAPAVPQAETEPPAIRTQWRPLPDCLRATSG